MNRALQSTSLLLLLMLPKFAAASIDTISLWDGVHNRVGLGIPNTQTFGQTITAPAASAGKLLSFSFEIKAATTFAFRGEVYAWDGLKATGPSLFESPATSTTNAGQFQKITFATGGITLTPGQTYVLFVSSSKDNAGHSGSGGALGNFDDPTIYPGGLLVYQNNGADPSLWTTNIWSSFANDLAFQATFEDLVPPTGPTGPGSPAAAAVPMSPITLLLIFLGLAGAGAYHAKHRVRERFNNRS